MPETYPYSDEQALLAAEIKRIGLRVEALEAALAALKAAVERQAEYQGVKHLLAPQ